jgi:hypothetical protein
MSEAKDEKRTRTQAAKAKNDDEACPSSAPTNCPHTEVEASLPATILGAPTKMLLSMSRRAKWPAELRFRKEEKKILARVLCHKVPH